MKKSLFIALLVLPILAISDPSPFGLEISKSTIKDVQAKYNTKFIDINKYSQGKMFDIDISDINFDGLQNARVIFDKNENLLAVLTTFQKSKFDYLLNSISKKYKLVSQKIPFVGNKSAKFIDGNTEITLDAPHMSFQMEVNYINKDLWKSYEAQSANEQRQKQKMEQAQL